jgi:outer membrane scaffolding protein for murein synthesis (MipA/OmpV family)
MTKSRVLGASLAATAAMMFSHGAFAQSEAVQPEADPNTNMVGAGVFAVPDWYGASSHSAAGAPLIHYNFDAWGYPMYVQFIGNTLRLNVSPVREWSGGPLIRFRQRRDDDVDNALVQRMTPVPAATEIGAYLAYNLQLDANPQHKVVFTGDISGNTTGVYTGVTGNLRATYFYPFPQQVAGYSVLGAAGFGLFFGSDTFANKYFGIQSDRDRLLFLPELRGQAYKADGGLLSIKVPFLLTSQIDKNWMVLVAGQYEHLLNDAADSPLVSNQGNKNQWTIGIGAAYKF